jgi:tyrosyl-tRNA synthetase
MWSYYQLLLEDGKAQRLRLEAAVRAGEAHPMRVKQDLALALTRRFHGEQAASRAEQEFEQVFKERQRPSEVEEHRLPAGEPLSVAVLLADAALVPSRSEARRLIAQGGVVIDGVKLADPRAELQATAGRAYDLKVGKRRFLRVRFD